MVTDTAQAQHDREAAAKEPTEDTRLNPLALASICTAALTLVLMVLAVLPLRQASHQEYFATCSADLGQNQACPGGTSWVAGPEDDPECVQRLFGTPCAPCGTGSVLTACELGDVNYGLFGAINMGSNWRQISPGVYITAGIWAAGTIISLVLMSAARKDLAKPEKLSQGGYRLIGYAGMILVVAVVACIGFIGNFLMGVPGNYFLPPWLLV